MDNLDEYMTQDIYEYLSICDKVKCKIECNELDKYEIYVKLYLGCEKNIIEMINYAIIEGKENFDAGLSGACYGGNKELIEMMIKYGAKNWNQGLYEACYGGHMDIIDLMIKNGATNWNYGLTGACQGGHIEIMGMMVRRGANYCGYCLCTQIPHRGICLDFL